MAKEPHDFIRDSKILSNACKEDCFDYASHAAEMHQRFKLMPNNSLIALVGNIGVGKTFLVKMMESNNTKNAPEDAHWLYFDMNQHLETADIWDIFRTKLIRAIRLNTLEMAIFNISFMVEVIRSLIFRTKDNAITRIMAGVIWVMGFAAILFTAYYFVAIFFAFITLAVLLGLLPFHKAVAIFKFLNEKLAPTDEDKFRDLLLRIRASKKDVFVVIDSIHKFDHKEVLFLRKIRLLLDRNKLGKELRIIMPIFPHTLKLCSQTHHLQYIDYIELFQPELTTDRFIGRVFTQQFIKCITLPRCKKLVASILETTNQNLHALKLIIRTMGYQNKHTADSNISSMALFKRLIALSSKQSRCLDDSIEMPERKKLTSPEG